MATLRAQLRRFIDRVAVRLFRSRLRNYFIERVGQNGDPKAVDLLTHLLPALQEDTNLGKHERWRDPDVTGANTTAYAVMGALGRIVTPEALKHLAQLATQTDWYLRGYQAFDYRPQFAAERLRSASWPGTVALINHLRLQERPPRGWLDAWNLVVRGYGHWPVREYQFIRPVNPLPSFNYTPAEAVAELWRLGARWIDFDGDWRILVEISESLDREWPLHAPDIVAFLRGEVAGARAKYIADGLRSLAQFQSA